MSEAAFDKLELKINNLTFLVNKILKRVTELSADNFTFKILLTDIYDELLIDSDNYDIDEELEDDEDVITEGESSNDNSYVDNTEESD